MTGYYSDFVEDRAVDNLSPHPHELIIQSSIPIERLHQGRSKNIHIRQCGRDGCEIYAPLGEKAGIPTAHFLFMDPERDDHYAFRARFRRLKKQPRQPETYAGILYKSGKAPCLDEIMITADGNQASLKRYCDEDQQKSERPTRVHHFHRVQPELTR